MDTKEANKIFYDLIADAYEQIDGRRSEKISKWLDKIIKDLSLKTNGEILLDLGCGTGFVIKKASKYFKKVYGIDISHKMIDKIEQIENIKTFVGDIQKLPFENDMFDIVTSVAVLHHIRDHFPVFKEVYRVLKKNGIFYTDHDIDRRFVKIFYIPLKIYRKIFDAGAKFIKANKNVTKKLYELSEVHSEGIEVNNLIKDLKSIGFIDIQVYYHWIGLSNFINNIMKLFGNKRNFPRGFAPSFSIIAKK